MLRLPLQKDIATMFKWENDPEIQSHSAQNFSVTAEQLIRNVIQSNDLFTHKQSRLAIADHYGKLLGTFDLFNYNGNIASASVGILIGDINDRHKSFGSDALSLGINYSKNVLRLKILRCQILDSNEASLRLFNKHNFVEVARNDRKVTMQLAL